MDWLICDKKNRTNQSVVPAKLLASERHFEVGSSGAHYCRGRMCAGNREEKGEDQDSDSSAACAFTAAILRLPGLAATGKA